MNTVNQVSEQGHALSEQIVKVVRQHLSSPLSKGSDLNLYDLVLEEIEGPLFRTVMEMTRYNQSKAARVLGVSRGTLRTKLKYYFDDEFIGSREE